MICSHCQAETTGEARFCAGCGAPLAPDACATCGASLPAQARFCPGCGRPVIASLALAHLGSPEAYTPWRLAEPSRVRRIASIATAPSGTGRHTPEPLWEVPITRFAGLDDPNVFREDAGAWAECPQQSFRLHWRPARISSSSTTGTSS